MVISGLIGIVVCVLIFMILRNQSLQREIDQYKSDIKIENEQSKITLKSFSVLLTALQGTYLSRLNNSKKKAQVSEADYEIANTILSNFEYVVLQCCEHNMTVEEAVSASLERTNHDMSQIADFIAEQSQEIKLPWCKNAVSGYITACNNISMVGLNKNKEISDSQAQ